MQALYYILTNIASSLFIRKLTQLTLTRAYFKYFEEKIFSTHANKSIIYISSIL